MSKQKKQDIDMEEVQELVDKYDSLKKDHKLDLSADQDLSIAIMNLISIEEHLFFSGAKTGKGEFYDVLVQIREMRKELLKRIIKEYEGEVWCISKHLLSASYRLMEYGTKHLGNGNRELAEDMFEKAFGLYSLFWGLNMGLIKPEEVKEKK
jgi:DNA-binding cell septation regulator SpoVG